jgi:hypothetical protein
VPYPTIKLLPWQAEFMARQDRIYGVIGGLGSGKSNIAANWLIDRCMKFPKAAHYVAGRDIPQLKRGAVPTIQGELDRRNMPYRVNKTDSSITLEDTGCTIRMLSIVNYQSLRSLECDSIFADELSDWSSTPVEFVNYLCPRLRPSPGGKGYPDLSPQLRFTTNPPTSVAHWLYELLEVKQFCPYRQVSTRDNFILLQSDPEYLPTLLRSMSEEEAHILIDGKWGNLTTGRVYKTFRRDVHCKPPVEAWSHLDPNLPLLWSLDFNVGLNCSIIAQMRKVPVIDTTPESHVLFLTNEERRKRSVLAIPGVQPRVLTVNGQIRLEDSGTPDVVDAFMAKWGQHARSRGVRLYGDVAGGARAQQISAKSAARSNWQIIVQGLQRHNVPVDLRVGRKAPPVLDRVNAFNAQCKDAAGAVGMYISRDLAPDVVMDIERCKYLEGKNDIDKSNPLETHLTDALGYLIHRERSLTSTTIRRR